MTIKHRHRRYKYTSQYNNFNIVSGQITQARIASRINNTSNFHGNDINTSENLGSFQVSSNLGKETPQKQLPVLGTRRNISMCNPTVNNALHQLKNNNSENMNVSDNKGNDTNDSEGAISNNDDDNQVFSAHVTIDCIHDDNLTQSKSASRTNLENSTHMTRQKSSVRSKSVDFKLKDCLKNVTALDEKTRRIRASPSSDTEDIMKDEIYMTSESVENDIDKEHQLAASKSSHEKNTLQHVLANSKRKISFRERVGMIRAIGKLAKGIQKMQAIANMQKKKLDKVRIYQTKRVLRTWAVEQMRLRKKNIITMQEEFSLSLSEHPKVSKSVSD